MHPNKADHWSGAIELVTFLVVINAWLFVNKIIDGVSGRQVSSRLALAG